MSEADNEIMSDDKWAESLNKLLQIAELLELPELLELKGPTS